MALLEILAFPDPRLAHKSIPIAVEAINDELRLLIDNMFETMYLSEGVGLAAPQVGIHKRMIVLDCGARPEGEPKGTPLEPREPQALINPEIIAREGSIIWEEGCLSVPDYVDEVERAEKVTVRGLDRHGQALTITAEGLLGVCLQHEIDHLDGVLFVDRLSRLKQSLVKKKLKKLAEQRVEA